MKKSNKAFSLIEIMISAIILSIAVFGVFKLIGENQKLINSSDNYKTAIYLFIPFHECIENIFGNNKTTGTDYYISLNNCSTGTTQTGITIDNIDYVLHGETSNLSSNTIDYILKISTDSLMIEQNYTISNN